MPMKQRMNKMKQLALGLSLRPLNYNSLIINHSINCLYQHIQTAVPGFELKFHLRSSLDFLSFPTAPFLLKEFGKKCTNLQDVRLR